MPTQVTLTGPGTAFVTDDAGAAILEQTVALAPILYKIEADLTQINANVGRIADSSVAIGKAVNDLNGAIAGLTTAQNQSNVYQAALTANQIMTNNFQMAVTKQGLVSTGQPIPQLPDFPEMIKTELQNVITFNQISAIQGVAISFINSSMASIGTIIAATAPYQAAVGFIDKVKELAVTVVPNSARTAKSIAEAALGKPATPE